jgi:hypothetical protein
MRGIDHPGVVKLIGFFESEEHYFLILECKSGLAPSSCLANRK